MYKILLTATALLVGLLPLGAQDAKTIVTSAWEHLDPDADYYMVMRPERAIDSAMKAAPMLLGQMMGGGFGGGPDPDEIMQQIKDGVAKSDLKGLGVLGMSQKTGEARVFLGRKPGAPGAMWEALPKRETPLRGIAYLPASSAVCSYGNLRPDKLLDSICSLLPAEMAADVRAQVEENPMAAWQQVSKLKGDWGAALTLHPTRTMASPSGEGVIPEPGFVMLAEAGPEFFDYVKTTLKATASANVGGTSCLKAEPLQLPVPNEFHLARSGPHVVLASNAELLAEVLGNLAGTSKGLLGDADFRSYASGFTAKSSLFSYVSPRAGKVLGKLGEEAGIEEMVEDFGPFSALFNLKADASGLSSIQASDAGFAMRVNYKGAGASVPVAGLAPLAAVFGLPMVGGMDKIVANNKAVEMKSNAKNMYVSVYADAVDSTKVGFPPAGEYKSSTEYFKTIAGQRPPPGKTVATRVLPVGPDWFAGFKRPAATWGEFSAANNDWCIVAGYDETADAGTPFAFSSNVLNDKIPHDHAELMQTEWKLDPNHPLGTKVVIAYMGGGAEVIDTTKEKFAVLNPRGAKIDSKNILRPGAGGPVARPAGAGAAPAGNADASKRIKTKAVISELHTAVTMYELENNKFPATLQDLVKERIMYSIKPDGWGNPLNYNPKTGEISGGGVSSKDL